MGPLADVAGPRLIPDRKHGIKGSDACLQIQSPKHLAPDGFSFCLFLYFKNRSDRRHTQRLESSLEYPGQSHLYVKIEERVASNMSGSTSYERKMARVRTLPWVEIELTGSKTHLLCRLIFAFVE